MSFPGGERIVGLVVIVSAVAIAVEASTFHVAFLADPIGPRAMPWLAAALVFAGALRMVLRPAPASSAFPRQAQGRARIGRVLVVVAAFAAYALLLSVLGFVVATTLLVAVLALPFGGRVAPATLAAALFSVALYLLFARVLGVPLPIGALFAIG